MPSPLFVLPELPAWAQQLANILPFAVLIEFIDVAMKLHVFELNGMVPLWSWPITPKGARMILSKKDTSAACCLDHADRCGTALRCIDGRYGDHYPSSAPTTVRLCVSTLAIDQTIPNESENLVSGRARIQRLDMLHVAPKRPSAGSQARAALLGAHSVRYCLVSSLGWLVWIALTCFSFVSGLYVGAAYLVLMPLTGALAYLTHGGEPRKLDSRPCAYTRLIVAADNMNATDWWGFYGGSYGLNSFLNRSLYRDGGLALSTPVRALMRVLILGQWVLALASCTLQDWNALVISFWVFLCALASEYGYSPEDSVKDWLRYTCNFSIRRIRAKFSSRRAMLSALVTINPDTRGRRLEWINPILEDGPDRREWEAALLDYIEDESCNDDSLKEKFCWKWIEEGVAMGRKIEAALRTSVQEAKTNAFP